MSILILNNLPWFWLGVMVICIIIEASTFSLTTIWFAIGALVSVFVAMTPLAFQWQLLIFAVISLLLLILTRPVALRYLKNRKETRTNVNALIGQEVPVTKEITQFEKGEVKCEGKIWSAVSQNHNTIAAGSVCVIKSIKGNTVSVLPKDSAGTGH